MIKTLFSSLITINTLPILARQFTYDTPPESRANHFDKPQVQWHLFQKRPSNALIPQNPTCI